MNLKCELTISVKSITLIVIIYNSIGLFSIFALLYEIRILRMYEYIFVVAIRRFVHIRTS
jgi:hypothetical protein